jgi:carbamoylphosphate synthase large subunit
MAKIVVTGVGGPAGCNVAALLLQRGHAVVGADMRDVSLPGVSIHRVPAASDVSFLSELNGLAAQEQVDLLIPTVTEELPIVAERWNSQYHIPVIIGPYQAVYLANDKYLTSERLASHGVTVPRYRLPSQVKSHDDIARTIGWPCLSKPRVGRGGRGVTVWHEADWPSIAALDDRFILQEFMPGADYAPNVCIRPGAGSVVVVLKKTKLKDGIVGNAAEVKRVHAPDVAALAVHAALALGFVGPLDIDIRRRADGKPAVLEINARFGANIANAPQVLDAALAAFGVS